MKITTYSYGFLWRVGIFEGHSEEFSRDHWDHDVLVKVWEDKDGQGYFDIIDPFFNSFRTRAREHEYYEYKV